MNIRSITMFCNPGNPVNHKIISSLGSVADHIRSALTNSGYDVQTCRLATIPFPRLTNGADDAVEFAMKIMEIAREYGFDYTAIGPALPSHRWSYAVIPEIIRQTQNVFVSAIISDRSIGISFPALHACGQVIHENASIEPNGFGNLFFTALASVQPGGPFFPSAYHDGDAPCFALALEAADLAVDAISRADSLEQARSLWIEQLELHGKNLTGICDTAAHASGIPFTGMDFTPASFPEPNRSIGLAMEKLGIESVGNAGTLAAAAFLTSALDQAQFRRAGFNGLMLPVLEDSTLALRAAEDNLTLNELLLYSAVCGTGLDTVPIPGDSTPEAITAVLLDTATLAMRLNKPLTARLMPIPGKSAGDLTTFDFSYFANSRVLGFKSNALGPFFHQEIPWKLNPKY